LAIFVRDQCYHIQSCLKWNNAERLDVGLSFGQGRIFQILCCVSC
jgi:hypothetical protein